MPLTPLDLFAYGRVIVHIPRGEYFVGASFDLFCIGAGSLAIYAACRLFHLGSQEHLAMTGAVLTIALNWPHFFATVLRLYGSRSHRAQYPITTSLIPILLMGGVVASLASPDLVAPYFLKLFFLWSPFHYCGQTIGISLLYSRRAGFRVDAFARSTMMAFVYLTFITPAIAAETLATGKLMYGVRLPTFGVNSAAYGYLHVALLWSGALAALGLATAALRQRKVPSLGQLLPPVAQYVWFVAGSDLEGFRGMVPAFHSLQYLAIAWAMHIGERVQAQDNADRRWLARETALWLAIVIAGGAVLLGLLPRIGAQLAFRPGLGVGVVAAAVQMHHFFVDGVIWKLRTRAVAHPLSVRLDQLFQRSPRAALPVTLDLVQ